MLAVALGSSACSEKPPPVEISEGAIPESIPADVPFPDGAAIGSSRVDHEENRTEVSFDVAWGRDQVVRFYTVELVSRGFIVGRSEARGDGWEISFSRVDLIGSISLTGNRERTGVLLRVNRS